ncbi:MAG: FAD:protein FMN transferase [Beijerinckiaceae bacterium]|nr:FAD:protein FMN transferase [Beijerinckiaceae bacterium]MCZ8300427.1 FAD:protein FMN transferase [Beijerinckiaceae bacterium]
MSTDPLLRLALNGNTMGTRYSVIAYAEPTMDVQALGRELHEAVSEVDAVMSNWKPDSDISRLNNVLVDQWIELPESLIHVLETALAIEAQSNGSFDIGLGEAVGRWGFGPLADKAPAFVGPRPITRQTLELDRRGQRARKHGPLSLDLSGIAKGYGVDRLGDVLKDAGLSHWLASIDGELRAGGPKADGTPWAVGLERPLAGKRELSGVIELREMAVATSGTYRQCRDVGGQLISHLIDPSTGAPVKSKHISVTVLAPTCMEADAWATAILVDGVWPPKGFAAPSGIDAIVLHEAE